jgi:hypothetical protein
LVILLSYDYNGLSYIIKFLIVFKTFITI